MSHKQTKKTKKPLQTSLGKAPGQNDKEEVDLSHVRRPIDTSIFGLGQVLSLMQTATEEVKNYVAYECDIMYECRICRTIFRSLANFILHKRNYCRGKFKTYESNCRDNDLLQTLHPPEPPKDSNITQLGSAARSLAPVIEKLKEKQEIKQLSQELLSTDLSSQEKNEENPFVISENDLLLEEIATNNAAVFQTVLRSMPKSDIRKPELMKNEVMEIHGILDKDGAVLGSDGKICNFQTNKLKTSTNVPKNYLVCIECNMKFSTKKTLTFHLRNKHNNSRLVYVCPDCKDTFSNTWCVYRHLYKVHRKTVAQVKRLREQIHNSIIRKDQNTNKKNDKKASSNLDKADEENQWLNNIEGDKDFQMCGGCGKRFERKAALQSHAALCIKRIAVCNSIKENNAKKKEEESKDVKNKLRSDKSTSPDSSENLLKGASKRKPYLLRTYKQIPKSPEICGSDRLTSCESKSTSEEITFDEQVSKGSFDCDNGKETNIHVMSEQEQCKESYKENGCDVKGEVINGICDVSKDSSDNNSVLAKVAKDKECFCSPSSKIDAEKMLNSIGIVSDDRIELIKEEITSSPDKCHKATNCDVFGHKVADHLLKIDPEKSCTSMEELSARSPEESLTNGTDYQSPGRISIRSLEELRGFPKEPEVPEPTLDEEMPVLEPCVSSKTPKRSPRLSKRKRTSSLDSSRTLKLFKQSNFDILLDKQDLNFMAKASPHMDRTNLTCKSCQIKHPSLSKLLWHMSAHFSWFRFQCSRCSFVSFGKSECSTHAKNVHEIKNSEISSVVLPIPNWKTSLMSNDFRELKNEDELGGKLTDEVNSCCQNELLLAENNKSDFSKNLIDTLFIDSEPETIDFTDFNEIQSFPELACIKSDCIDITNNEQENFQLEVPQEIYTLDVFEVINDDDDDERQEIRNPAIKEEIDDDSFLMPNCSTAISDIELDSEEDLKNTNNVVIHRPTRNRMRSIKTLQNDFFYDLGRVTRQVDAAAKMHGTQKQKKNNTSSSVSKKYKEMRVYTKNK